jgi:hypothetical protein
MLSAIRGRKKRASSENETLVDMVLSLDIAAFLRIFEKFTLKTA